MSGEQRSIEEVIGWIDVGTWPESGPDGVSEVTVWERPDGPQTTLPADLEDLLLWIFGTFHGKGWPVVEPATIGGGWMLMFRGPNPQTFLAHRPFEAAEAAVRALAETP